MANDYSGLFRSDKYLIIQRDNASFAPHGIWCDTQVTEDATEVPLAYLPPYGPGRGIVSFILRARKRRTCTITVPVCDTCKTKPVARGNLAGFLALAVWALGGCLIAGAVHADLPPNDPRVLALIISSVTAFAAGLIILLTGLVLQGIGKRPPATFIDDSYAWLSGVNRNILAKQPEWTGDSLRELNLSMY